MHANNRYPVLTVRWPTEVTVSAVVHLTIIASSIGLRRFLAPIAAMLRRMEDRIRRLCEETVAASDPDEQLSKLAELRSELHNHMERLRARLGKISIVERRRVRNAIPPPGNPTSEISVKNDHSIQVMVLESSRRAGAPSAIRGPAETPRPEGGTAKP